MIPYLPITNLETYKMLITAKERLAELKDVYGITVGSHSWGPEASSLSEEARAQVLLDSFDRMWEYRQLPQEVRMLNDLRAAYEAMGKVIKECQFRYDDPEGISSSESRKRLSRIFGYLEMTRMQVGNWIRNETIS